MSNRRKVRPTPARSLADSLALVARTRPGRYVPNHEPSAWLAAAMAAYNTRALAGQVTPCTHLRPGMPAMHALWAPDRVVCARCRDTLALDGVADQTCDRCGTVTDRIHPNVAASADPSSLLLVMFGLCPECNSREYGEHLR